MSSRNNVKKTYLTDDEASQLSEWADEANKSESTLIREAVMEYLDKDRSARIEGKVRELDDKMDEVLAHLSDDSTHTHKDSGTSTKQTSSMEKLRKIVRAVQNRDSDVIKNSDLDHIIGNFAGLDNRTKKKYRQLMRERGLLLERPGEIPTWTTEKELWTEWLSAFAKANGTEALDEFLEPYPATISETASGIAIDTDRLEASH